MAARPWVGHGLAFAAGVLATLLALEVSRVVSDTRQVLALATARGDHPDAAEPLSAGSAAVRDPDGRADDASARRSPTDDELRQARRARTRRAAERRRAGLTEADAGQLGRRSADAGQRDVRQLRREYQRLGPSRAPSAPGEGSPDGVPTPTVEAPPGAVDTGR